MEIKNTRWIGIDGGGTKTSCVIGDRNGHILSKAVGTSSNIQTLSPQKVFATLTQLIEEVLVNSNSTIQEIEGIQLCLAGADRDRDKAIIQGLFENTPYEHKIFIKNDAQAALASGTWGESGLLLIAGTGSIVYGISNNMVTRVGGWGYLLGDEGSGFYIGQKALRAVMQAYDNRGTKTDLTPLILNHFQVEHPPQLISLYSSEKIVPSIAEISKFVFEAAKNDDAVSLEILDDAITELMKMVKIAIENQSKTNLLVIHGGLFSDLNFKNQFIQKIQSEHESLTIVEPEIPAVIGAYLLALKETPIIIDERIKNNIQISWCSINH